MLKYFWLHAIFYSGRFGMIYKSQIKQKQIWRELDTFDSIIELEIMLALTGHRY